MIVDSLERVEVVLVDSDIHDHVLRAREEQEVDVTMMRKRKVKQGLVIDWLNDLDWRM